MLGGNPAVICKNIQLYMYNGLLVSTPNTRSHVYIHRNCFLINVYEQCGNIFNVGIKTLTAQTALVQNTLIINHSKTHKQKHSRLKEDASLGEIRFIFVLHPALK